MANAIPNSLKDKLQEYNQEGLLKFWDELDKKERTVLAEDIANIDLAYVASSFKRITGENQNSHEKKDDRIEPLPDHVFSSFAETHRNRDRWENLGLELIANDKVAVILLAGGQGTRLGVNYPKGMYKVGLPSDKSLYQIQGQRIVKLEELAYKKTGKKGVIPWYIMTSEHTKEPTRDYFAKSNYFGLNPNDVIFFEQRTLPCLTFDGKIILRARDGIARAPDGNGGLYHALDKCGILDDLKKRKIEHIHVYCVDNILIKMADPVFIGYCASREADCGAKAVKKIDAEEPVGVVCLCDNKYQVIEYSEISKETAEKRNSQGDLAYNAANICNHYFHIDFLTNVIKKYENELPHHIAKKKIPYVDDNGQTCKPDAPNGIKMEKFVFDVFRFSKKFAVMEVKREEEFSPLKNKSGSGRDCPETAKDAICNLHCRYILNAGGKFLTSNNQETSNFSSLHEQPRDCEISPLLSYAGENLEDIVRGQVFQFPVHLKAEFEKK